MKAAPRPQISDHQAKKTQYAIRFADAIATHIASDLGNRFVWITATTKRDETSSSGRTQLDINFSTPEMGLALGISLKSVHLPDVGSGHKYGHNKKRNTELLAVTGCHRRHPYAVIVGVLFLPFDSCTDGQRGNPSSFGSWVRHLRPHVGRSEPDDDIGLFEKMYVALYEQDGSDFKFFDVESDPPKNARPGDDGLLFDEDPYERRPLRLLNYGEFLGAVRQAYLDRNPVSFKWADGEEEMIDPR